MSSFVLIHVITNRREINACRGKSPRLAGRSSYNRRDVQNRFGRENALSRFAALACFFALLLASFAGPIHKHSSAQETTCLMCHASDESADTVPIASDAGKLHLSALGQIDTPLEHLWVSEPLPLARSPRAPPQ
jgi:hypothetical protein